MPTALAGATKPKPPAPEDQKNLTPKQIEAALKREAAKASKEQAAAQKKAEAERKKHAKTTTKKAVSLASKVGVPLANVAKRGRTGFRRLSAKGFRMRRRSKTTA